jgi:gamma-glutamyltranspeptidase
MTTSISAYFGSNVLSKSLGIVLSINMDDFANPGRPNYNGLHPSPSNYIVLAGKKPFSSMAPTMVFRLPRDTNTDGGKTWHALGDSTLVLGASGGHKIISTVMSVLSRVRFQGLPLFDAMVHPGVHDQLIYHGPAMKTTENTVLEQGPTINMSQRTRNALTAGGHRLLDVTYAGTVQAISVGLETKELTAACDVRKGG